MSTLISDISALASFLRSEFELLGPEPLGLVYSRLCFVRPTREAQRLRGVVQVATITKDFSAMRDRVSYFNKNLIPSLHVEEQQDGQRLHSLLCV